MAGERKETGCKGECLDGDRWSRDWGILDESHLPKPCSWWGYPEAFGEEEQRKMRIQKQSFILRIAESILAQGFWGWWYGRGYPDLAL